MRKTMLLALTACGAGLMTPPARAAEDVLAHVRAANRLTCGVLTEPEDYTKDDVHGPLDEFGPEICKAVATAVLGRSAEVAILGMHSDARGLSAVVDRGIDVFATAAADQPNAVGGVVTFGPAVLLDGQSFLVRAADGIHRFHDLDGKQVCFIGNTRHETVLHEVEAAEGIKVLPFPFEEVGEMEAALVTGHCTAMTADVSMLADARSRFHALVSSYVILPDRLTADPVAPASRADDKRWAAVIAAVVDLLRDAEAAGITQQDVVAAVGRNGEGMPKLLTDAAGVDGLATGWQANVIAAVGNAGEIYRRTIGAGVNAHDLPRDSMKPRA